MVILTHKATGVQTRCDDASGVEYFFLLGASRADYSVTDDTKFAEIATPIAAAVDVPQPIGDV